MTNIKERDIETALQNVSRKLGFTTNDLFDFMRIHVTGAPVNLRCFDELTIDQRVEAIILLAKKLYKR